ncbi:hypothetical protein CASFOL_029783 [Castilleja foliolosa]|uniref:RNase H type-1 domain-containing protein n=1 Tax=Castilleja foliolosa TaxID=1961234 RepID=A0ABD3C9G8_9LAMI
MDFVSIVDKQPKDIWKSKLLVLNSRNAKSLCWKPPDDDWFKANSDSTFLLGEGCAGVVIKNSNGSIIFASTALHYCLDPLTAECLAILHACKSAAKLKKRKVILESDCLEAITLINGSSCNLHWTAGPVVIAIKKVWTAWPSWIFRFNPRCCNRAAHNLAHWGACSKNFGDIPLESIPVTVFCDKDFPLIDDL